MQKISYARYRFPPVIIQHAVWLYFRFPLSYRDIEDLVAERGIDLSYETVRRWALKFGQVCVPKSRFSWELGKTRMRRPTQPILWGDAEGPTDDLFCISERL